MHSIFSGTPGSGSPVGQTHPRRRFSLESQRPVVTVSLEYQTVTHLTGRILQRELVVSAHRALDIQIVILRVRSHQRLTVGMEINVSRTNRVRVVHIQVHIEPFHHKISLGNGTGHGIRVHMNPTFRHRKRPIISSGKPQRINGLVGIKHRAVSARINDLCKIVRILLIITSRKQNSGQSY